MTEKITDIQENKPKKNFGDFVFTITDIKEDRKCNSES